MKTMRVREIMTKPVQTLPADISVAEAALRMATNHISGAPVVDHGRVVGVVSRSDLIHPQNWPARGAHPTVDSVMTRVVLAVRPGDPVMSAVRLMLDEQIHRVIVVDDNGTIAGIVSPMDVLRALAHGDRVQDGDFAADHEVHREAAVAVGYVDLRTFEVTSERA